MKRYEHNVSIQVDLTNPGQFFACCGLLELADRLWPGTEGWFGENNFQLAVPGVGAEKPLERIVHALISANVGNTMSADQVDRLEQLNTMSVKERSGQPGLEEEKKSLEALRRESPIVLGGHFDFRIDWFRDEFSGGSRFKTWAGQQSVLDIANAMQNGIRKIGITSGAHIWTRIGGIGLPFNFDSDLGGQGSALDIGFSLDPLAASESTRIEGVCRPAIELLSFIGLQRFRPKEFAPKNGSREKLFSYAAWRIPLSSHVAAPIACGAIGLGDESCFEFRLLYRTKYLKSFLPAIPIQGEYNE